MTVDDLPSAFASVPAAWRGRLPGWTAEREREVVERIRAVSGDRPLAPADPFRALRFFAPDRTQVIVIGQDPYPRPGHADGLAFSCANGRPPSLRRIFDVLKADRPGFEPPRSWALDGWARQGVLLLNTVLTIEAGRIGSHAEVGWQALTSEIVGAACRGDRAPAVLLWGKPAAGFFERCGVPEAVPVWRTRHPSNDFRREFMADGSHFAATADRVDWWCLDGAGANAGSAG